jgi:hypothetical protein
MINTYSYSLKKYVSGTKKMPCPACGKLSFVPYVDATGEMIAPTVGRCDHLQSCGYHLTPREWFTTHPTEFKPQPIMMPQPTTPPEVIDLCSVEEWDARGSDKYYTDFCGNCAERGLRKYFDDEAVHRAVDRYHLQAWSHHHNTAFPAINQAGRVTDVMIIGYQPNLHRNGICFRYHGTQEWQQEQRQKHLENGFRFSPCLFGEHLLAQSSGTVCLVESQKTAVIGSIYFPEFTWLATCGCEQFKEAMLRPLKGREVYVYPDSGTEQKWQSVIDSLPEGYKMQLRPIVANCPPNTDIADVWLAQLAQWEVLPVRQEIIAYKSLRRQKGMAEFMDHFGITAEDTKILDN